MTIRLPPFKLIPYLHAQYAQLPYTSIHNAPNFPISRHNAPNFPQHTLQQQWTSNHSPTTHTAALMDIKSFSHNTHCSTNGHQSFSHNTHCSTNGHQIILPQHTLQHQWTSNHSPTTHTAALMDNKSFSHNTHCSTNGHQSFSHNTHCSTNGHQIILPQHTLQHQWTSNH